MEIFCKGYKGLHFYLLSKMLFFFEKVATLPVTFAVVLWERHLFIENGAN